MRQIVILFGGTVVAKAVGLCVVEHFPLHEFLFNQKK